MEIKHCKLKMFDFHFPQWLNLLRHWRTCSIINIFPPVFLQIYLGKWRHRGNLHIASKIPTTQIVNFCQTHFWICLVKPTEGVASLHIIEVNLLLDFSKRYKNCTRSPRHFLNIKIERVKMYDTHDFVVGLKIYKKIELTSWLKYYPFARAWRTIGRCVLGKFHSVR